MTSELYGYMRKDGRVGVRNALAVIPTVFCANHVAKNIAARLEGAFAFTHSLGCGQHGDDLEQTICTLEGIGKNPNMGAVLLVGLGCERIQTESLAERIRESGKPVEVFVIQKEGGSLRTIEKAVATGRDMVSHLFSQRRERFPMSKLCVGLKCGGSDATSGISANPAVGVAADRLIAAGAVALLSEVTELLGTGHILCRRAENERVATEIRAILRRCEEILQRRSSGYERTVAHAAGFPRKLRGWRQLRDRKRLGWNL